MKFQNIGVLALGLSLASCVPKTPLEESFQSISPSQDRVGVIRCSLSTHDKHLGDLRKKGWRVSGEARLKSATRLSDFDLKQTAMRKGARAVLVSESSVTVATPTTIKSTPSLQPKTVAPASKKSAELSLSLESPKIRVREKTAPLPQETAYRVHTTISKQQPKSSRTEWTYRVSFLSNP